MIKGVILIGVGRNLNRAIRTCYSFGIYDIYCYQCNGKVTGSIFSAEGKVRVHKIDDLNSFTRSAVLALELMETLPILQRVDTHEIEYIALGGESVTLRKKDWPLMARIKTDNNLCLTTEAALAIALFEMSRRVAL